jgi:hypothetical protein
MLHPVAMPRPALLLLVAACLSASIAQAQASCPPNAVFLALEREIRGYALRSNGQTIPCQVFTGAQTTTINGVPIALRTARALAFSRNGFFHVAQFLTNGNVSIFRPDAAGEASPSRAFLTQTNDLVAIAVDRRLNDFVASPRSGSNIFVFPDGSSGRTPPSIEFVVPFIAHFGDLAIDQHDDLLVAGVDGSGQPLVLTLATSSSLAAPATIRTLKGPRTGLLMGGSNPFTPSSVSIALDPVTQELYVYNASLDRSRVQVSVFAAHANGDIPPERVIEGLQTRIGGPGALLGTSKIAVSGDGRLFVAEPSNRILVFAAGAFGNVPPAQVIIDTTAGAAGLPQGGIAVRSAPYP